MKKKAVIYCRIATSEDINSANRFSAQEIECRKFAKRHGYEVIAVFSDCGSGIQYGRRALSELLTFSVKKKYNISTVITKNPARLSRNCIQLLHILSLFDKHNIRVLYTEVVLKDSAKTFSFTRT